MRQTGFGFFNTIPLIPEMFGGRESEQFLPVFRNKMYNLYGGHNHDMYGPTPTPRKFTDPTWPWAWPGKHRNILNSQFFQRSMDSLDSEDDEEEDYNDDQIVPEFERTRGYTELPVTHEAMHSDDGCDDLPNQDIERSNSEPWIPFLKLTMGDKRELENGRMLSDKHIYAAQKLLRKQFPHVAGLQDTCLSQTSFQSEPLEGVQIHHTRGNHWVLSTSSGGAVMVYDTIYSSLAPDLKKQLAEVYEDLSTEDDTLMVELPNIPKQRGSKDCGMFAIAIAYELCTGNNKMQLTKFIQEDMRDHLMECFERQELRQFPQTVLTRKNSDDANIEEIQV